jgi:hypothetical protein
MMPQTPTPPIPPHLDPNLIFMQHGGPPAIVFIVVAALAASVIILWPVMRAFGRRLEGKGVDAVLRAEVDQLQARLGEIDVLHNRLADLEERLDFTERMLAQTHDAQNRALRGDPS